MTLPDKKTNVLIVPPKNRSYLMYCPLELKISWDYVNNEQCYEEIWGLLSEACKGLQSMDITLQIIYSPSYYLVFSKTKRPLPQSLKSHALAPDHVFCVCFCCISTWSHLEKLQTTDRAVIHLASEVLKLHPLLHWVAQRSPLH